MRTLVLLALLAGVFVALPAMATADAPQPCAQPYVRAYACFFGSTGVQYAEVCGKDVPGVCVPIW